MNGMSLEDQDRISELPDSLIHHILSFLSTKEAFVTYILSTRWKCLWSSIPKLDFKEWRSPTSVDVYLETKKFMNFMDRILLLRDFSTIQIFRLSCNKQCDESRANAWISTVISRNVEDLYLRICLGWPFVLPCCLFSCQSLTKLKLKVDPVFKLPTSVSLPKLRELRLSIVRFEDEYSIQKLLSNCPVLEQLVIKCRWWGSMKNERISHAIPNDDILHLPSLQVASVNIKYVIYNCTEVRGLGAGYRLTKLLSWLSNVRSLRLSGTALKALLYACDRLMDLPRFYNLTSLRVISDFPCSANPALLNFLEISPNLKSLCFNEGLDGLQSNDWVLDSVPQCLLLHLERIVFRQFDGSERDIFVLQLFLKNAMVLKSVKVVSSFPLSETTKEQILKFPRGPKICMIKFCEEDS